MAVYKFKVVFDDEEEVTRTIEIRSNNGFQDFHNILIKALEITVPCTGTFFVSDNDWHKDGIIGTYGEEAPEKNPKISSQVHDPHQRFLYEVDTSVQLHFTVELIKILPDTASVDLPICIAGEGEIPKYYFKRPAPIENNDEDLSEGEQSLLKELEAMMIGGDDDEPGDGELESGDEDASSSDSSTGDDEEEDDYKNDMGFEDGYDDDIDMSGFSEDEDFR